MSDLLHIEVSPMGARSISRSIFQEFLRANKTPIASAKEAAKIRAAFQILTPLRKVSSRDDKTAISVIAVPVTR